MAMVSCGQTCLLCISHSPATITSELDESDRVMPLVASYAQELQLLPPFQADLALYSIIEKTCQRAA